jgi:TctA family transporter
MGPLVKQFGSPEFLMLTMLGIAAVSVLSGGQPLRGLIAAGIGLMLASVGGAALTPYFRYSLGAPYLYDGIPLILIALGVFGVAEIIDLIARGLPIAGEFGIGKGVWEGVKDTIRHKWLIVRCSIIGCYVGFVPGMGTTVANWLGYGHAVQSAKGVGDFGRGDIRGVIAPESANNAARGGELIPTLLFGVPGSGSMALLLLAFIMFGIFPGPDMIDKHLDLVFQIVWTLVLGNIVGAIICVLLAKHLARVATIKINLLAPFVIIILVMGAFQATQHWGDLLTLLLLGTLGWVMKQTGFGRPPVIVGFVLGKLAERYLGLSVQRYGMTWLWHPWVIVIGILIIVTLYLGFKYQKKQEEKERESAAAKTQV